MDFYTDIKRDVEFRKNSGAHFTPSNIVVEMCSTTLDMLKGFDLSNFRFLDLASGTGVFSFYLAKLIEERFNIDFRKVIDNCCYMSENDGAFIKECRSIYSSLGCSPKIIRGDSLFVQELQRMYFDIVISNPPYIRIQNLESAYRRKLQSNYKSCSFGAADIYLSFMELGLDLLKPNGVFSFITPSSYLRSESGKHLRKKLLPFIKEIKDFGAHKNFDCGTYTALTYAIKNSQPEKTFKYILEDKAIFVNRHRFENKLIVSNSTGNKLINVCKIRGGVATLRDKIFIIIPDRVDELYAYIDGFKIELASTKKFVKLSKVKNDYDIQHSKYLCIYPYKDGGSGYEKYSEKEFSIKFPETYKYLFSNKTELLKRDRGKYKGYEWFEFGRTQGLVNNKECIITSTMNIKPNFISTNLDGVLVGSGLVLYDSVIPIKDLISKLNGIEMENFMKINGIKYSKGWSGYSKKILGEFQLK